MKKTNSINQTIKKLQQQQSKIQTDYIAYELPLEIRLSHDDKKFQTLAITLCSPLDCEDLLYGYLYTENIITNKKQITSITIFDNEFGLIAEIILNENVEFQNHLNKRHGMVHASCGVCGKTNIDDWLTFNYPKITTHLQNINPEIIMSLPEKIRQKQQDFQQTGALHASALFSVKKNDAQLQLMREDIGRHNALDKLIGAALKQDFLPLNNYILLLSGRMSFELVHKSLIAGVRVLSALGAPSSLCIEVAKLNHLQLYGFVKSTGFNQY